MDVLTPLTVVNVLELAPDGDMSAFGKSELDRPRVETDLRNFQLNKEL